METFDSLNEEDSPAEEEDEQSSGPGFWLLELLLDLFPGSSTTLLTNPSRSYQGEVGG